jgi:hypothetical protein
VSVTRVKCASCGSEWDGYVVFCGECGTPVATPSPPAVAVSGDRSARLPPQSNAPPPKPASLPPPNLLTKPGAKPPPPSKPAIPAAKVPVIDAGRQSRPTEPEPRRTVMGMPAVTEAARAAANAKAPPSTGRRDPGAGGRKGRRGSMEKMLDDLDAGFDSIVRPSDAPAVPSPSPSSSGFDAMVRVSALPVVPPPSPSSPAVGADAPAADSAPANAPATDAAPPDAPTAPAESAPVEAPTVAPEPAPAEAPVEGAASEPPAPPAPERTPEETAARAARHEADMAEVRTLFSDMAVAHARPLRDFMIEVAFSGADPTKEWLDVAAPAATSLRRAAEAMEMPELCAALEGFTAALELVSGESAIHREARELLLGAYGKLIELLPAAFALEGERGRREPIIIRSLLLQVPGLHKVTLDKIYAAGLTSLVMLTAARPADLAETTGIDVALAGRIVERLQAYKRELAALDPTKDRAHERAALEAEVAALGRLHDDHEKLAAAWSQEAIAARVRARKDRGDALLRVNVLLARLGEVDRLAALEKLPFQHKLRELSRYLDEARRKAPRS